MSAIRVYVFFIFGISITLYFLGYTSPFLAVVSATDGTMAQNLLNAMIGIFTNPVFLAIIGVSTVTGIFSFGRDFTASFLIPMLLLQVMLNFFVLPTNFITDMSMNPILQLLIGAFLNMMLAMAMLEFVRSG